MEAIRIAAAYIRVSTEDQTEYSPAAQLRELREYAGQHRILLDDRFIYADEGISGRRAEKRPAFMQMIADAKRKDHPFDVILVHKFDRFARSREDSIVYKSMLKRAGVEVISIKEPLSEGSYSGVMEAIYESFAEAYSINLGQEVRKGMTEKALRGEPQTTPPFGYRIVDHQFTPHETEAPIVRQIFERFVGGEGYYVLARWLNAQGIRTHRGNEFENRTIEYIIRNPVYIGKLRWNPKRRSRRNFSDPDILTVAAKHPPIIDLSLWDAAQKRVAEIKAVWKYHGRPAFDRKHWLCGIVRCASCGATLVFTKPHNLMCNNHAKGRCLQTQRADIDSLTDALLRQLNEDLHAEHFPGFRTLQSSAITQEERAARLSLERAERKKKRLTEAYLAEAIDLAEFKSLQASLDSEIEALKAAVESVSTSITPAAAEAKLRQAISKTLDTLNSDASVAQKYESLLSIIEGCTYERSTQTLKISYRISL